MLLLGGSTAGALTVWDLTPLLREQALEAEEGGGGPKPTSGSSHNDWLRTSGAPPALRTAAPTLDWLLPSCHLDGYHAMGVNCLCLLPCETTTTMITLASGGDDQAVGLCRLDVRWADEKLSVATRSHGVRPNVHSAGVRGIAAAGRLGGQLHFLSAGADGQLLGWRVAMADGANFVESLQLCWRVAISIEQVHALCVCGATDADADPLPGAEALAVVVGCGVEAFRLREISSKC